MLASKRIVVFSDIHSNLEAFQAVLAEMRTLPAARIICLGDIVGYAASPRQCLELVRCLDCEILKGNHDCAVADNATMLEMSAGAALGIKYARQQLSETEAEFLSNRPMTASDGECQFVHSSLDHPEAWTYLTREPEIREHFEAQLSPIAFCGHTHIPSVVWMTPANEIKLLGQGGSIKLPAEGKVLINVGAVGQPRDRCPAACYVIYDSMTRAVEFRRLPYDIKGAQRRILESRLPQMTADRLALGR